MTLMMETSPEISVVAPSYNERENIQPFVDSIRGVLDSLGVSYEVVITDDGSSDGTWDELRRLAAANSRVRALRFAQNCGQSAAIWAGIQAARGKIIVTLDADLQNPPQEIPKFLEALKQFDCVCGTRVAARRGGDSLVKVMSSRIANWVRNKLSGETISDAGCCFRAFRRECVANIKFFRGAHRFLPTLIRMEGFSVTEIPVAHHPRRAGSTHYGIWNRLFASFADLLAVRWMKKRHIRYKISQTLN
jgi:dolichol-phosphate mannosyltransferase